MVLFLENFSFGSTENETRVLPVSKSYLISSILPILFPLIVIGAEGVSEL